MFKGFLENKEVIIISLSFTILLKYLLSTNYVSILKKRQQEEEKVTHITLCVKHCSKHFIYNN